MRKRAWIVCCLLLATLASAAIYAADLAVIVHPGNPVRAMTLAEFAKVLKGKSATWPTGRNITVVMRDPGSPAMKFLVEKVMGVGADEAKSILTDPSRRGSAPVVFAESDEEIVKLVGANSSAIGVVDVYNITGSVKVIKIDEKQPFDPGYALKSH
jgi:ABC-type phosphate transport system substrate-binding protein